MSTTDYEVMVAFNIGGREIEMIGSVADDALDLRLAKDALDQLLANPFQSLEQAIVELGKALDVDATDVIAYVTDHIRVVPVIGDAVAKLIESPIYLTDLEFHRGVRLVVGVMIEYSEGIAGIELSRFGVKVVKHFAEST